MCTRRTSNLKIRNVVTNEPIPWNEPKIATCESCQSLVNLTAGHAVLTTERQPPNPHIKDTAANDRQVHRI